MGTAVGVLEERLGLRVAWISRGSAAVVPTSQTLLQEHDRIHVAAPTERLSSIQRALSRPWPQEA